jgi:hypothetical protein
LTFDAPLRVEVHGKMQALANGHRIDEVEPHPAFGHVFHHAAIFFTKFEIHELRGFSSAAATALGGWWR